MDQQFSLTWNNFQINLSKGFAELLNNDEFVDVTLAVEGHLLRAHQVILSICSPYFREMFRTNPCQHPIVVLKDVKYAAMHNLLLFMYNGEVSVKQEDLTTFINTANVLEIKGLSDKKKDICDQFKSNSDTIESLEKNNESARSQKSTKSNLSQNIETNSSKSQQIMNTLKRKSDEYLKNTLTLENISINKYMRYHEYSNTGDNVEQRRNSAEYLKQSDIDNHCNVLDQKPNCEIILENNARVKLECESDLDYHPTANSLKESIDYESSNLNESQIAENCEHLDHIDKYKYILSRKGHKQLVHRNFVYTKHSTNHGKTAWRCVQYFSLHRCPATIDTVDATIHNLNHNHNHEDFYDKIIKSKVYEMSDVAD